MDLVNPAALIVFVVLITAAYTVGTAYIRKPYREALHSNAVALNALAALAIIVVTVTYPDLAWGWKAVISAAAITMVYLGIQTLNYTRDAYEANQKRSFVQTAVEHDRNNRQSCSTAKPDDATSRKNQLGGLTPASRVS
jgi:TRAP-type C4-dicarboxylate transport system permease large subunit